MYEGIPYGRYLDTSVCRVSIDNIRLKFTYKYQNYSYEQHCSVPSIDKISCLIDGMFFNNCDTTWSYRDFFKIGSYCRTCSISGNGWSCAVLFGRYCFDNSCKLIAPEAVFDFNPNKVPDDVSFQIIHILRDSALSSSLSRFDVAFDFPIPRDEIHLVRDDLRRSYRLFLEGGAKTEYLGARSSHGSLKLYDKSKESELSCDVTRCEITVARDFVNSLSSVFPKLYLFDSMQLDLSFSYLPFPVQACILHPDMFDILRASCDPKTFRKYRGMIDTYGSCLLVPPCWPEIDRFVRSAVISYVKGCVFV